MKPEYGNWIPRKMIVSFLCISTVFLSGAFVFALTGIISHAVLRWILFSVFSLLFLICFFISIWSISARRAFSYNGKRRLSMQIIEGVATYVSVPDGGSILDVGCGSGALAIACAKQNPDATVTGIDRWGKDYELFSKQRCEDNAKAEGVENTRFVQGDAAKLDFPDESFDAVTSNYVYHNMLNKDKHTLLLETLRVLKKGGVFVIHDLMNIGNYGDMHAFTEILKKQGYRQVELIDTTNGMFMTPDEAKRLMLKGSTILYGIK